MNQERLRHLRLITACLVFAGIAAAQSSSGVISGRVLDSSGLGVANAPVTLMNPLTAAIWSETTAATGEFTFTGLQPGTYNLQVKAPGFKTLEKTGLALSASERLSAGTLVPEIGSTSESIEVKSDVTPVQTTSSERSALLDTRQVNLLMTKGRDLMGLLVVMPGVVNDSEGGDRLGVFKSPSSISGTRGAYGGMNIDGISGNTRSGDNMDTPMNIDAVAEVKVLSSNYQAEYGKAAGGIINIVTKGGSQQFHGLAYFYNRNEAYNANNFFNNMQGLQRPRYRYNTFGSNLGGPIFIPGKFNRDRHKLFFFFSQEYIPVETPNGPRNYTVPTALERAGNFSQSRVTNAAGTPVVVNDPFNRDATGKAIPFPNNIVPSNRIDPNMQKMLNIFPMPNTLGPNRAYNLQLLDTLQQPTSQESLRVDYNISQNVRAFFRGTTMATHNKGPASTVNRYAWMKESVVDYATTGPNLGGNVTWTISPTLVHETVFGYARWTEDQTYDANWLPLVQRDKLGINLPQQFPKQNPLNLIPSMDVGSAVSNRATMAWEGRFPMVDVSDSWSFTDSISKVWRKHLFKAGVQYEHVHYLFDHSGKSDVFTGSFNFGTNTNNTFTDTGYGYANALLGYFNSYSESTNRSQYSPVTPILEWYVQDSWKVTPRLTLDLGVRFTAGLQQYAANNFASEFVRSRFDPAKAPLLYQPGLDGKTRVAIDPRTGTALPDVYIGQIIPGTGDLKNGVVVAGDAGYPRALVDFQGILPAPKLGFSWDPFGTGKTAIRGGGAVNYEPRNGSGFTGDLSTNPPLVYTPTQNYGTTATYASGAGTFSPPDFAHTLDRSNKPPRVYMASLSIQRNIGFDTVVDIAYVGSFGRHLGQNTQLNQVPYGARFLPSSQDPTKAGTRMLDQFLRPYQGYGSITYANFQANSSYHSLQTQAQKRLSHGLQFGVAYTWSKAMAYTDTDRSNVVTEVSRKEFNYGPATYDRTHVMALNYLWDLPKASKLMNNFAVRNVLDGWQLVGITRYTSGAPLRISTLGTGAFSNGLDITGGGDGWRPVMSKDPVLPGDQRTWDRWFNASAFAPPTLVAPADMNGVNRILAAGNTPIGFAKGPGIANWNISLYKNFAIREKVKVQFRAESYNTFNHTQFSAVNVAPQWNPATGALSSAQFGQVTSARDPRIMQFALRVGF
jgi:hypothetical protein